MLQSYESGLKVRVVILPPPNLRHPATAEYVWESLAKEYWTEMALQSDCYMGLGFG